MFRLLSYLKQTKGAVVMIICLLLVQAYCDLGLPSYTSDIVDVGIQQSGIEYAAPTKMRESTMEGLQILMTDEELEVVNQYYTLTEDGVYERTTDEKESLEEIHGAFVVPMMLLDSFQTMAQQNNVDMQAMIAANLITREQIIEQRDTAMEQLGDMSSAILNQRAVAFVKAEYEAMDMDVAAIQRSYLLKTGAKMLGFTLIMILSAIGVSFLASRAAATIGRNLRGNVFERVLSFSSGEINQFSTASLITRSTNDIQQVQFVSVLLLRMVIYAPILGVGGILKVIGTKTGMAWIIAVAVGAVMLLVAILVSIAMPKFKIMQTLVDKLNLVTREILTGVSVIRAFSREKYEEKRFGKANEELMQTQLFTNRVMTFMMPMMMLLMNGITVMIVWFGAKGIDAGNLQVGDMMAFMTYTMQIVMGFLMLAMLSILLPRAGVAADRIEEVLKTEPSIVDAKQTKDELLNEAKGELTFNHVSFSYPGAEDKALEDITFTARPGETTAIIGSTGCGKSTLLNLIPRLYEVSEGSITVDGVDIREVSQHKLRNMIGLVPQKGILFSGTIASNIKLAGEDAISDKEMVDAARTAQAEDFILEKTDKYESSIAQGGSNVSGGQKQRLAIARVIAKHPKIYLFDDSFSALDYKTDAALRKALNQTSADATVLIVAQRISTIMHADQILVLDNGKIVGCGTHEELLANCEEYQEIASSQLSASELKGGA